MMNESTITHWLNHPHALSSAEQEDLKLLLQKYPYFVPGRYMEAAVQYQNGDTSEAFSIDERVDLFKGNHLFFYEFISGKKRAPVTDQAILPDTDSNLPELDSLIQPASANNYFQQQGIEISDELPSETELQSLVETTEEQDDEKSLMVMMTFDEWLAYFKTKKARKQQEEEDKKMLKAMWQREKLAAALEEESDEIPENVFEMAINSIDKEDTLVSESLAEIHSKQGRYDKAIEIYRKLSLQNPQKKAYFAAKIDHLIKEKQS